MDVNKTLNNKAKIITYYILSCLLIIGILFAFDMKSICIPNDWLDFEVFAVFSLSVLVNGCISRIFMFEKIDKISFSDASNAYKIFIGIFRVILNIVSIIIIFLGCIFMIVVLFVVLQHGTKFMVKMGFYDYYIPSSILALYLVYWLNKNKIKTKKKVVKTKRKK